MTETRSSIFQRIRGALIEVAEGGRTRFFKKRFINGQPKNTQPPHPAQLLCQRSA